VGVGGSVLVMMLMWDAATPGARPRMPASASTRLVCGGCGIQVAPGAFSPDEIRTLWRSLDSNGTGQIPYEVLVCACFPGRAPSGDDALDNSFKDRGSNGGSNETFSNSGSNSGSNGGSNGGNAMSGDGNNARRPSFTRAPRRPSFTFDAQRFEQRVETLEASVEGVRGELQQLTRLLLSRLPPAGGGRRASFDRSTSADSRLVATSADNKLACESKTASADEKLGAEHERTEGELDSFNQDKQRQARATHAP
jgi:hypothetical protein